MFGFIGKFKQQVVDGFDSVHQRLVTLETRVDALFYHTQVVAAQDVAKTVTEATAAEADVVGEVKADAEQIATDASSAAEEVKNAS